MAVDLDDEENKARNGLRFVTLLRILSVVPIIAAAIYVLFFLQVPPAVSIVNATVEQVSFEATSPEMSQLSLRGFNISAENPNVSNLGFGSKTIKSNTQKKPICSTAVIIPDPGTKITYRRFGDDQPIVIYSRDDGKPVGTFKSDSGDVPDVLKTTSWLRLDAVASDSKDNSDCSGKPTNRYPIFGNGDIGNEFRPAASGEEPSGGMLLDGTLDVMGHTLELGRNTTDVRDVYPTWNQLILPPGSRLTQAVDPGEERLPWIGFAVVGDKAFDLKVTSDARRISLIRPGIGMKPELISLSLYTQLVNDPTLTWLQVVLATFFGVFQVFGSMFSRYEVNRINRIEMKRRNT
jgi:hypothetical protein